MEMIKVLGVADPAVLTYGNEKKRIISNWTKKSRTDVDFSILPWEEYYSALMKTLSEKNGKYDIVMIAGHLWLKDFVNRGYLRPLNGIKTSIEKYGPYDDILPMIRNEIEIEGTPWLVPSFTDGHIIFYKRDDISRITGGILPVTLKPSEYLDLAEKISLDADEDRRFLAMKAHPSEIFLDWLPFFYETGGELFDDNINPLFNTPEAADALGRYLELKQFALPGAETAGNEEICAALKTDECLIGVSWGGQASFIFEENMGCATFNTPWNVSWSFGVPAGVSLTEETLDFLAYLASPDVDRIIGAGAGSPIRTSSYRKDDRNFSWYPVQEKMVSLAKPLPGFTGSGDIYGLFYKWIFRAFKGETNPEETLSGLEKEVITELKKLNS